MRKKQHHISIAFLLLSTLCFHFAPAFSLCGEEVKSSVEKPATPPGGGEGKEEAKEEAKGKAYESFPGDPFHTRIYTLKNGMKLYLLQNRTVPRLQTFIAVRAGSADENKNSTGLAHYFEHMMFKGSSAIASLDWVKEKVLLERIEDLFEQHRKSTDPEERKKLYAEIDRLSQEAARYSNNEYWELLNSIGARGTNAWTSFDETVYTNDIPVSQLEKFLFLESERFSNIALRRFHTELETVYEEFNRMQDRDSAIAYSAMLSALFPNHPYGRMVIGLPEHLKSPSMKDIHQFFNEYYTPENMALIIAGDLDYEQTAALAERYFGNLPRHTPSDGGKRGGKSDRTLKEPPLTGPKTIDVTGPDREAVFISWRFPSNPESEPMLQLISGLLSNGKTGLIDSDLLQPQKVQSASAWANRLRDYSLLSFYGEPRSGQTPEEVRDLILKEVDKLRKGEFDPRLIKAIADNMRYELLLSSENRESSARQMVDLFILGDSPVDLIQLPDKIEKITPQQIMDFARENLKENNYVLVNKRSGPPSGRIHAEKPLITPVPIPEQHSAFAEKFRKLPVTEKESAPEFIDFQSAMEKTPLAPGLDFYYLPNRENERFSLLYVFPAGRRNSKKLSLAFSYANLLGTDKFTPTELRNEFFRLAVNCSIRADEDTGIIEIQGLQRNFKEAATLLDHLIRSLKPDRQVYDKLVESILKERENQRKSPDSILQAMQAYAVYGRENPVRDKLSEAELKAVDPAELTTKFAELPIYEHDIVYYGPEKAQTVLKDLQEVMPFPKETLKFPEEKKFKETVPSENMVYVFDYPSSQTQVLLLRADTPFSLDKLAFASLFQPYAGRTVMRDIREKRGLAYTATAFYSLPEKKDKLSYAAGYVGTQGDKLPEALRELKALMEKIPDSPNQFHSAREKVLQGIRSDRIQREGIYTLFRRAGKRGLHHDWRKNIYEDASAMTLQDFNAFHQKHVAGKNDSILLIGDLKQIDRKALESFGKIKILTLNEIF